MAASEIERLPVPSVEEPDGADIPRKGEVTLRLITCFTGQLASIQQQLAPHNEYRYIYFFFYIYIHPVKPSKNMKVSARSTNLQPTIESPWNQRAPHGTTPVRSSCPGQKISFVLQRILRIRLQPQTESNRFNGCTGSMGISW